MGGDKHKRRLPESALGLAGSPLWKDGRGRRRRIAAAGVRSPEPSLIVAAGCCCRRFRVLCPEPLCRKQAKSADREPETYDPESAFHFVAPFESVGQGHFYRLHFFGSVAAGQRSAAFFIQYSENQPAIRLKKIEDLALLFGYNHRHGL